MRSVYRQIAVITMSAALLLGGWGTGIVSAKDVAMVPANFTQLAEKAKPGVVNISTVRTIKGGGKVYRHFFGDRFRGNRNPFDEFFGPFFDQPQRDFKQRSLGSGFIIDAEGYIVTNNHVVAEADQIKVKLANEKEYEATIVGRDPKTDLALIKIDGAGDLKPLPLGDSDSLKVGTWVVAIGSPFGLEQTVTAGIVSAKGRIIGQGPYDDFIQTDASINPGNSGGPLLDLEGNVVGINTAIIASGQGIGFAIPARMAEKIVAQLKDKGEVIRGWLGVGIQDLTPELAEYYGLDTDQGVLVTQVFEGDPAEKAGIKPNDIIVSVDGQQVTTGRELSGIIANTAVGGKTRINLLRGGEKMAITATVAKRPEDETKALAKSKDKDDLGIQVSDLSRERAQQFGLDVDENGVLVIDVESGSRADEAGLNVGDIIKGINRKRITNLAAYQAVLGKADKGKPIHLLVMRRNEGLKAIKIMP
ncbi:MAG: DegQ family serine endoprotease [Desulfosarcinaceae bacterium]